MAQHAWIYPGGARAQDHRGPVRVGGGAHAQVEHDLDLGLPHPRGRRHRRAGAGLHPGQRVLLRGARPRPGARRGQLRARGSRSSGTSTTTSSRRSPSSARPGGSGPGTCASATARGTRGAGRCGSTARPPASRSPRSSRTTTWCGWPTRRWPRCSAAPSRSTPTRWTRRWRCPTEESVRIALRTQQILAYETGVPNVADPLGGSYYLEALTDGLEREAEGLFAEIEAQGGVVRAIESGWFQRQIAHSSMRFQAEVEQGRRTIVGVNDFVEEAEAPVEILKVGDAAEQTQRERHGRACARERDAALVEAAPRGAAARRRRRSEHHTRHAGLRACLLHAVRDPACARGDLWELSRAGLLLTATRRRDGRSGPATGRGRAGRARRSPVGGRAAGAPDPGAARARTGWSAATSSWSRGTGARGQVPHQAEEPGAARWCRRCRGSGWTAASHEEVVRDLERVQQYLRTPGQSAVDPGRRDLRLRGHRAVRGGAAAGGATARGSPWTRRRWCASSPRSRTSSAACSRWCSTGPAPGSSR